MRSFELPMSVRLRLPVPLLIVGLALTVGTDNFLWGLWAMSLALLVISWRLWPVSLGIFAFTKTANLLFVAAGLVLAGILYVLQILEPGISWRFLVHYILSVFQCSRHEWSNALVQINKALQISPESVSALSQRATIYWFQDRMTDMEVDARRLVEAQPQSWYSHRLLGQSLCCQSRYQEALISFMKSLEVIPEVKPRKLIGAWYSRRCEIPREAQILSDIGGVHYLLSDFATAIHYYKAALVAQPITHIRRESLFRLGKCYETLGRSEDAQDAFAKLPAERDGLKQLQRQALVWPSACARAKLELSEMEQLIDAYSQPNR